MNVDKYSRRGLHQTYSYFEHVVLQREIRKAVPEAASAFFGFLTCLEQVLARVVDFELRHICSKCKGCMVDRYFDATCEMLVEYAPRLLVNTLANLNTMF